MPVTLCWLVEDRITIQNYIGNVTVEEINHVANYGISILDNSDEQLSHSIIMANQLTGFPRQVAPLIKVVHNTLAHPKMGWLMSVGIESDVIRFVSKIVVSATRARHRVVDTYEEAAGLLMQADATLPNLYTIDLIKSPILLCEINGDQVIEHRSIR